MSRELQLPWPILEALTLTSDFCSCSFCLYIARCYHLDLLVWRGRTVRRTDEKNGFVSKRYLILRTKSALNLLKSEIGLSESIALRYLSGPTRNHNHNHCWGGYILDPIPSTSHHVRGEEVYYARMHNNEKAILSLEMRRSSPEREGYANLPSGLGCKTLHSTAQILYRLIFNRLPVPSSARNK